MPAFPPSPTKHWALEVIGCPWTVDGFGPRHFNCWGLIWWRYNQLGIELPKYSAISPRELSRATRAFEDASTSPEWFPLNEPEDECVAAMSSHKLIHHVGIYLAVDGGRVLHASDGNGVLCQPVPALKTYGYSRVNFYKHKSWPPSLK